MKRTLLYGALLCSSTLYTMQEYTRDMRDADHEAAWAAKVCAWEVTARARGLPAMIVNHDYKTIEVKSGGYNEILALKNKEVLTGKPFSELMAACHAQGLPYSLARVITYVHNRERVDYYDGQHFTQKVCGDLERGLHPTLECINPNNGRPINQIGYYEIDKHCQFFRLRSIWKRGLTTVQTVQALKE